MFAFLEHPFVLYIYQPFFNILVGIYWLIGELTSEFDIGIAVIIFAIVVRIIMLPLNFFGDKSTYEKKQIANKIDQLEKDLKSNPAKLKIEIKKVMKSNPKAIISESITLFVQVLIVLMLYRIFKTGLEGADLHLLYRFMPNIPSPINLMFLDKFDLSKPNFILNIIQSSLILIIEMLQVSFNPQPTSRKEFISLVIFLPLVSFIIFAVLPSGKKLFIITSLLFSIFMVLVKQAIYWYNNLFASSQNLKDNIPNKE